MDLASPIILNLTCVSNIIYLYTQDQADSQVSSNPRTAFPYAVVMVSLMNADSELRDLILGYFYIQCPYLLPYYPTKQPEQSTEDYFG